MFENLGLLDQETLLDITRMRSEFRRLMKDTETKKRLGDNIRILMDIRGMNSNSIHPYIDKLLVNNVRKRSPEYGMDIITALKFARILGVSLDSLLYKDFRIAVEGAIIELDKN